jgi:glycosyltransferase involved in cell wall biosynthesis
LQELEPYTHAFDTDDHIDWRQLGLIHRSLEAFSLQGPRVRQANAALLARCHQLRPDLLWIDKGEWVWPSTLRALRAQGCFLVHHITDAVDARKLKVRIKRRLLRKGASLYDVFFTTNIDDQAKMATTSPPIALLTDLGYDHRRFDTAPLSEERAEKWDNQLIFIGHHEPRTEAGILALVDAGLPVTVYGYAPWFASKHRAKLGERLRPSLDAENYAFALKGARIGLCFVSELNYNQTASRSFEIPGSGTFLLAMRTPQHLECYEEGKEAEFFGDYDELVRKAAYYLEHHDEREAIARRGHDRCVASGYSWDALMAKDWPKVKRLFAEHRQSSNA